MSLMLLFLNHKLLVDSQLNDGASSSGSSTLVESVKKGRK